MAPRQFMLTAHIHFYLFFDIDIDSVNFVASSALLAVLGGILSNTFLAFFVKSKTAKKTNRRDADSATNLFSTCCIIRLKLRKHSLTASQRRSC